MKFDIIIGNPPYNIPREKANGNSLWDKFVKLSLESLKDNGFLCLIHPPSWRNINNEMWKIITKYQIHYLEIHGLEDGRKSFGCLLRYDWYILQKSQITKSTIIKDELGNITNVDIRNKFWIPNFGFELFANLLPSPKDKLYEIIHSNEYRTDKTWILKEKTKKFKYPITHGIENGKQKFIFSSEDRGHFGVSKVICNITSLCPINDFEGNYGMCKDCFGFPISSKEEGEKLIKILETEKFKKFIESIKISGYWFKPQIFNSLKKDFWKEFMR